MNKFIVFAALVACAYGVPVPEAEGEREGRDVFLVQPYPAAPFIPQAGPVEQDPFFTNKPNGVAVSLLPSFNFSSLFPSSNSNGGYYIARDPAVYTYPYFPQAIQPYPLFRHAPIAQPLILVPVEQAQAAPVPAEANADAAAPSAEQIQGRLFSLQVPSDLSSVSVTKPTLLSLANSGTSGIVAGLNGLSGIGTSATLAALSGSKNVAIDSNGNLFISG